MNKNLLNLIEVICNSSDKHNDTIKNIETNLKESIKNATLEEKIAFYKEISNAYNTKRENTIALIKEKKNVG